MNVKSESRNSNAPCLRSLMPYFVRFFVNFIEKKYLVVLKIFPYIASVLKPPLYVTLREYIFKRTYKKAFLTF